MVPAKLKNVSKAWQHFAEHIVTTAQINNTEIESRLINAFAAVPRAYFIEDRYLSRAASDISLPISFGEIMYTPSFLVTMLALLKPESGARVLHVGSGSGYLSAVMSALGMSVFAIEKNALLAKQSRKTLDHLGFQSVVVKPGDGSHGWLEHAPYDAIIVTTLLPDFDFDLLGQLENATGRLIGLIGNSTEQSLCLWTYTDQGLNCNRVMSGNLLNV